MWALVWFSIHHIDPTKLLQQQGIERRVHKMRILLDVANVQRLISTCWLICQMWSAKINPANKPHSCDLKSFLLETKHCCQESNQYSHCSPHLISFMLMLKWKTHLVLATTGPVHSPIQLWVAGCSHSAPQSAAYILQRDSYPAITIYFLHKH